MVGRGYQRARHRRDESNLECSGSDTTGQRNVLHVARLRHEHSDGKAINRLFKLKWACIQSESEALGQVIQSQLARGRKSVFFCYVDLLFHASQNINAIPRACNSVVINELEFSYAPRDVESQV